jgi:hypothetical protein
MPTIIVDARDEDGRDLTDVMVKIDGVPPPGAMLGRAISLDPGDHTVRWELSGRVPFEAPIVVREGEKGRRVTGTLRTTERPARPPWAAYVLAGTALAAGGVFGGFGIKGITDRASFGCDRSCASSQASRVQREFLVADIALVVAVISLAGATWLFVTSGKRVPATASAR